MVGVVQADADELSGATDAGAEAQVRDVLAKIDALADLRAELAWHLIGPLQSNKTRAVALAKVAAPKTGTAPTA